MEKVMLQSVLKDAAPPKSERWALASLSLMTLLAALGTSIANVSLPSLVEAFNASFQAVQWVVLAYLLAMTALIVSVGRLGDLLGRRSLLLSGLVIYGTASLLAGLAPNLELLIAARFIQGLGAAIMMALSMALVSDLFPKEQLGRAMGWLGTSSAVGTALGPSLGGLLLQIGAWRCIFLVNLPIVWVALFLAYRYLPRTVPAHDKPRFDLKGTICLAIALSAFALSVTWGRGQFGLSNLSLLALAAISLVVFIKLESKASAPLVPLALFKIPELKVGFISSGLVASVLMTTLVVGPFYLSQFFALTVAAVGVIMSIGPVVAAISGTPSGYLVDKFGATCMTRLGLGGVVLGAFMLTFLPNHYGLISYVSAIIVITASYALFQAANNTTVMQNSAAQERGLISGILNLARNLGLLTGASVMGAIFAVSAGGTINTASTEQIAQSMQITFLVATLLVIIALVITLKTQNTQSA